MTRRAAAGAKREDFRLIAIPVFDDYRLSVIEWIERLAGNAPASTLPEMALACGGLQRVGNSPRHVRLSEFVHHAILATEAGQYDGARYILITALAAFGWPSNLTGPI